MKIEDFARYVDAIAPTDARIDPPYARPDSPRGPRRSRTPVLASIAGLAAAALVAVVLVGVSTRSDPTTDLSTEPGDTAPTSAAAPTSDPMPAMTAPIGSLTVKAPGGPVMTVELADAIGVDPDELAVTHQVGFTIGTYGYDLTVYENQAVPFDPCGRAQPCMEVAAPVTNPAGLVVRSWAPSLVAGAEPTTPTTLTVEPAEGGAILALPATFAGAPLTSDELARAVSYDAGAHTFEATVQGEGHPLVWTATMIQPPAAGEGAAWIVNVAPSCDGADRCESGLGVTSLAPPSGEPRPIDALVRSVSTRPAA